MLACLHMLFPYEFKHDLTCKMGNKAEFSDVPEKFSGRRRRYTIQKICAFQVNAININFIFTLFCGTSKKFHECLD